MVVLIGLRSVSSNKVSPAAAAISIIAVVPSVVMAYFEMIGRMNGS